VRGLVHKSRIEGSNKNPYAVAKKGDTVLVEIVEIDEQGRYKLKLLKPKFPLRISAS